MRDKAFLSKYKKSIAKVRPEFNHKWKFIGGEVSKTIIRNKAKSNYITVSRGILKDKRLSLRDRGLMITLLSFADDWDFSVRGMTSILSDGKASVQKSLQRLEELNYITRSQERDENGKYTGIVLVINEDPKTLPCTEIPSTVIPPTGKPMTENRPQYKNINKCKNINEYKNNNNRQNVNNFNGFHQRTYDYAALERDAIGFT